MRWKEDSVRRTVVGTKTVALTGSDQVTPLQPQGVRTLSWWQVFRDDELNALENAALIANQNLLVAAHRISEARAQARAVQATLFPALNFTALAQRAELSDNRPNAVPIPVQGVTLTTLQPTFDVSYEVDLWGRIRRSIEAAEETFAATAFDYEAVRLSLTAEVARNYVLVRLLDIQDSISGRTLEERRQNVAIAQSRFDAGLTTALDVTRAESELAIVESQIYDVRRARAESEHALADLCGVAASGFAVPVAPRLPAIPPLTRDIPLGTPSEAVLRRPDVARAAHLAAAAAAQVGVAQAAFFPALRLALSAGTQSGAAESVFNIANSRTWLLGGSVSLPVFDWGRNAANAQSAEARYDQTLATLRQTSITAIREAEDALAGIRLRGQQAEAVARLVNASRRAADLAKERYQKGLVSFVDVINADRTLFDAETNAAQVEAQRLQATVQLARALGGW